MNSFASAIPCLLALVPLPPAHVFALPSLLDLAVRLSEPVALYPLHS